MKSLHTIRTAMRNCQQTPTQNILQHGISVANHYRELKKIIFEKGDDSNWKLPDWIYSEYLWSNCQDDKTMLTYMIYHDLGKPFCLTIDEQGKSHFPDHANVSKQLWLQHSENQTIAQLIGYDMLMHTMSSDEMCKFADNPLVCSLIISALCELHSNCHMFGGISSDGFKIKWKKLNKLGKMYLTIKSKS